MTAFPKRPDTFIFLDLECTCWKKDHDPSKMETIEIGAVRYDRQMRLIDEFDRFVRPVVHPQLSEFCTQLTSITQLDVDQAETFRAVFDQFLAWAGDDPLIWYSWGKFDLDQLERDLARIGGAWSKRLKPETHFNLKQMYADWKKLDTPAGMMKALRQLEIPFEGRHHRGIDDARHMGKIAAVMFADPAD